MHSTTQTGWGRECCKRIFNRLEKMGESKEGKSRYNTITEVTIVEGYSYDQKV